MIPMHVFLATFPALFPSVFQYLCFKRITKKKKKPLAVYYYYYYIANVVDQLSRIYSGVFWIIFHGRGDGVHNFI